MAGKRTGLYTVKLAAPPSIAATSSIAGPKEAQGPLRQYFDQVIDDELWGEKSWEKAESKLISETLSKLLTNAGISTADIQYIISGDLLNQCISSSFGLRKSDIPFLGVYGACSTMAESLSIGSMVVDGGFADNVVCMTSSHFCSAEKQFRFPLELGTQRPLSAQWTVTGAGAVLLASGGEGPYITHVTVGRIVDMGISDVNNMGAAMAPAAADTIVNHLRDTGRNAEYYDMIVTGDLGLVGSRIFQEMMSEEGYPVDQKHRDCGLMIFDCRKQDVHSGGSGCGCSATVLAGYINHELAAGSLRKVLFVSTGALLSTTSSQQGETIPGIAHAVAIEKQVDNNG